MLQIKPGRKPDWRGVVQSLVPVVKTRILAVLEEVGKEMVDWLKSLPPQERGWIARSPHGLADSYEYEVVETSSGVKLVLRNTKFYAAILEHRDGLFVLTGVTDPGGPVEQKLAEVCARIAPDIKVVRLAA